MLYNGAICYALTLNVSKLSDSISIILKSYFNYIKKKCSYAHPQLTVISLAQAPGHRMSRSTRPSDKILMTEILWLEDVPVSSDETFDRAKYVPSRGKAPADDCVKINPNASNSIGYLFQKAIMFFY